MARSFKQFHEIKPSPKVSKAVVGGAVIGGVRPTTRFGDKYGVGISVNPKSAAFGAAIGYAGGKCHDAYQKRSKK